MTSQRLQTQQHWEYCTVTFHWCSASGSDAGSDPGERPEYDGREYECALRYFSPDRGTMEITLVDIDQPPECTPFARVLGLLEAGGWELVTLRHRAPPGTATPENIASPARPLKGPHDGSACLRRSIDGYSDSGDNGPIAYPAHTGQHQPAGCLGARKMSGQASADEEVIECVPGEEAHTVDEADGVRRPDIRASQLHERPVSWRVVTRPREPGRR